MGRALSDDLRERVDATAAAGESCRTVALRFGVAVTSVVKWSQRHRATGSVAPGKMGGHRRLIPLPYWAFIIDAIERDLNLSLHRLKDILAGRGVKVSHNTVWQFLRREGPSFKKNAARP